MQLLKPGDIALGGAVLGIKGGHIPDLFQRLNRFTTEEESFDPTQIFPQPLHALQLARVLHQGGRGHHRARPARQRDGEVTPARHALKASRRASTPDLQ